MPRSSSPDTRPLHDRLAGSPAALIRLARFEPPDIAVDILVRVLAEGDYAADPHGVSNLVGLHWATHARVIAPALAEAIRPPAGADFTAAQGELLLWLSDVREPELRQLIAQRYEASAGPGDARCGLGMLCKALSAARTDGGVLAGDWALPIVRKLVEVGGAEIGRAGLDAGLLGGMLLLQQHHPGLLVAAFQHLARGGRPDPLGCPAWGTLEQVFPALETALEHGLPARIAHDLLPGNGRFAQTYGFPKFFAPLRRRSEFPRLRAAMLQALAAGVWRDGVALEAWRVALGGPAAEDLAFTLAGLEAAVWSLRQLVHGDVSEGPEVTRWVSLVATAWLCEVGLRRPADHPTRTGVTLDSLSHFAIFAPGLTLALQRQLELAPHSAELDAVRNVAAALDARPELVGVALLALPSEKPDAAWAYGLSREEVQPTLTHLLQRIAQGGVADAALSAALRGLVRVELRDTPAKERSQYADAIVWREGDTVITEGVAVYQRLCAATSTPTEALHACALYFIHELFHVAQGIQEKRLVTALRAAASEHTLGHLDLEADDIAARVVSVALGADLIELKELEGRLTEKFPATFHHTHASIARKSARLLGLRLDVLLREHGWFGIEPGEAGYAFVEVPSAPGFVVFMWAAGVRRVLATVKVSQGEAEWLSNVALGPIDIAMVDARLGAMLERAELVSNRL